MLLTSYSKSYGGNSLTLTKIREGNFSSEFSGIVDVTLEKVKVYVNHTLPGRGQPGESHLIKVVVEHLDPNGDYQSSSQAHTVFKTLDGIQVPADVVSTETLLTDLLAVDTLRDALINGES